MNITACTGSKSKNDTRLNVLIKTEARVIIKTDSEKAVHFEGRMQSRRSRRKEYGPETKCKRSFNQNYTVFLRKLSICLIEHESTRGPYIFRVHIG